jgi:hypothetical protein
MEACPWAEQVSAWWERSDVIFCGAGTPTKRLEYEADVNSKVYKPPVRYKGTKPEQYTEEVPE